MLLTQQKRLLAVIDNHNPTYTSSNDECFVAVKSTHACISRQHREAHP